MRKHLRVHGVATTAGSLALCLLADVMRAWLKLVGERKLAEDLLTEERRLWA